MPIRLLGPGHRFQRLRGHDVRYFCGDDTHGTATMIRAQQEGRAPEDVLEEMSAAHQEDFRAFGVEFDHYGSTHSPVNEALVGGIWQALRDAGFSDRDIWDIAAVAAFFNMSNRMSSAVDMEPNPEYHSAHRS